jgi:hypothetical protein|nr:MAG TPA: replication initiator protein [Caudoviricetes sp.]
MNKIMQMRMEMRDEVKKAIDINADNIDDIITDRYMKKPEASVVISVEDIADALGVSVYSVQNNIDLIQTVIIDKFGYIVIPYADDDEDIIISLGIKF